jgi:fumarate reductase subunit C
VRAPSAIDAAPAPAGVRAQVLLWAAQRISALVLAVCVVVHLVTAIYAIRAGLSAAEILSRTRGNIGWALFYGVFVAAVAVHAPIGLRNIILEMTSWKGRSLHVAMALVALALAWSGWRAVYAVVAGQHP